MIKVLIVEDDPDWQWILQGSCQEAGCQVIDIATTPQEALAMTREHNPDIITVDGSLVKRGDGVGTAKALRKVSSAKIIMISATGVKFEGRGFDKGRLVEAELISELRSQKSTPI